MTKRKWFVTGNSLLRHLKRLSVLTWVGVSVLLLPHDTLAQPKILGVRHWCAPHSVRVVLDLSDKPDFETSVLDRPPRMVTDLLEVLPPQASQNIFIQSTLVSQIRLTRHSPGVVRLVLDLKEAGLKHNAFLLPPMYDLPFRLVIDVESPELADKAKAERREVQKAKVSKTRVVVIDPGHGGEDPGALGPRRTKEKDVVLAVAKMLQNRLNTLPDMQAFITRTTDYYVSLGKRIEIAQDYGADLLISIHADACPARGLRGASVYCLSFKGATDEAARILAERENAADFIGGIRLDQEETLNAILLDLMQTQTINDSLDLGGIVLKELTGVHQLKFTTPRQAGFQVLKAPDIPSVLIELGFISNPRDEQLLRNPNVQRGIVRALDDSIRQFLCQQKSLQPDPLTPEFCERVEPRIHIVESGQNLSRIAALYSTSVREIQRQNNIKNPSNIYPGQRLVIP